MQLVRTKLVSVGAYGPKILPLKILHSPALHDDIEQSVRFLTGKKVAALRSRLSSLLERLCCDSMWSKFSCPENVVNLSDYSLKRYKT